ncbi:hypothetical protein ABW19_dt0208909 [Dactylella cylindrospora]|nr:hypothetical protein ABW19_dt0208909 [Dactylella cylindrospora]
MIESGLEKYKDQNTICFNRWVFGFEMASVYIISNLAVVCSEGYAVGLYQWTLGAPHNASMPCYEILSIAKDSLTAIDNGAAILIGPYPEIGYPDGILTRSFNSDGVGERFDYWGVNIWHRPSGDCPSESNLEEWVEFLDPEDISETNPESI